MRAEIFAVVLGVAVMAGAQSKPAPAPPVLLEADVQTQFAALAPAAQASGSAGSTLVDYGSYKLQLSVRTASGGAEVHAHWDDVMMVEQGSATLVTGGTVVNGTTGPDGETHGAKIEGGDSRTLKPGDMVTVRAGTPHQILVTAGTVYGAVVVKIHEP
jgi:mannose-6-phosphate isomerase-like protein (cupin superfamily)